MPYTVQYSPEAEKTLLGLDRQVARRVVTKIKELAEAPEAAHIKALHGDLKGVYRLRVGDYRVLYSIRHEALLILVLDIRNRKDIYR
jgi:mRNA interferase RelE/StbE